MLPLPRDEQCPFCFEDNVHYVCRRHSFMRQLDAKTSNMHIETPYIFNLSLWVRNIFIADKNKAFSKTHILVAIHLRTHTEDTRLHACTQSFE